MAALPKLCLAASGGGHLRQILDLEPLWRDFPHVIITEDTALGQSLAEKHPVRFVPHFALGQARLGQPLKMLGAAARSIAVARKIIAEEAPDFFITTGAGSQLFPLLWARSRGARIILVDSFARFDRPSKFAKLVGPLSHERIAQSARSASQWPGSIAIDPFRLIDTPRPAKEPLLLATVGAILPFDRLIKGVAAAKAAGHVPEHVIAQTGLDGVHPANLECYDTVPFDTLKDWLRRADIVVCHGGTGSLITALREGCRVVAMPRLLARGEGYDDHQCEIVEAFVGRGLIVSADDEEELPAAIERARAMTPVSATTDYSALIDHLRGQIEAWRPR